MHGIRVLMAKNYIDNLSEEIKKGLKEKAEQGYYPHKLPIGYKTETLSNQKKILVVDSATAPYVQQAFEWYATGRYTYVTLAKALTEDGFRPNGHACTSKNIERILNNPFYIGMFKFNGKHYSDAQHEAIISKDVILSFNDYLRKNTPPNPVNTISHITG